MGAELHLARRYLVGLRRRTDVATVTLISLLGLALGVMALVVTLALLEGFQSTIRAELIERTAHARVVPAQGRRLASSDELASILRARLPGSEIVEVVRGTCLVASAFGAVPASVVGRSDGARVELDRVLAARLGGAGGETVQVISPRQRLTPMGPLPVRRRLEVDGVRQPEPGEESGALFLPLETAQRLLWGEPVVGALEIRAPADPWRLARTVRDALGDTGAEVRVQGVEDLHRPLLLALALERAMIFAAVALMLVVAALNLLCNVAMIAAEKRADLALVSSLGMTPAALRRLFLAMGLGIGLLGSLLGAGAGTLLAVVLDRTQALGLPRGVFVVSAVPFRVDPALVALVVSLALALSLAAAWGPASMVARREPLEGLRYE